MSQRSNRRTFLRNMAAGTAVMSSAFTGSALASRRIIQQEAVNGRRIVKRELGSTGFKASELGFGAMNTRNEELIHAAIDSGINYIDTAHGYMRGENERIVGRVMKTKRDKVFLVTKVHARDKSPDEIRSMIETSLKRLGVDYVDCLFMHMPPTPDEMLNDYQPEVFQKAKDDGLCRFIGVSTHTNQAKILNANTKSKTFDIVLVGYNFESPAETKEAIAKARKEGIGIVGMKTQLKGKGWPDHEMGDITINQAALKWVLQDPNVDTTIPGMTTFEQLDEDLAVMGMEMSFRDRMDLNRYSSLIDKTYCRGVSGCTGCSGQCPKGVDICEINRCLGYARGYGDTNLALERYSELPSRSRIERCDECDECLVKCAHGLDLTGNIRQARALFA